MDKRLMLFRLLQAAIALTLLVFVSGAPATTHAQAFSSDAGKFDVVSERASVGAVQNLAAPSDHSGQHSHHPGCSSCCACSGGACQSAATLPASASDVPPAIVRSFVLYEALSPPRRARASLEHPPKSFA